MARSALAHSVDEAQHPVRHRLPDHHPQRHSVRGRGYFRRLGPGLVTGAADDDPSGIGTYSQVGAATGYALLWTAPLLLPLAFAVQEACARLALVTGEGLAVPVLAGSTSYARANTFGWSGSLELRPRRARAFYAVIMTSIILGGGLNLVGLNPIQFLFIAAVLNGLVAPVLMAIIWWLARDRKLLGSWRSPWWSRLLLGGATVTMAGLPLAWLLAG